MLAAPLNALILKALADGPQQQAELRRHSGSPAQTTLRAQLKRLVEIGALAKRRRNRFPGSLEYELTASGRDLLFVGVALERWLENAPEEPLRLGGNAAKAAVKALAEGWSTTMLRALAARPLSLTELDRIIGPLSYPSLERRLGALRFAGLVEARPGEGRGTPYAATDWLRRGVAPLAAAARWERRHRPRLTRSVGAIDVEAALLLAIPTLKLHTGLSGVCRVGAELPDYKRRLVGVEVEVEDGDIASCSTNLDGNPGAWALGSISAWFGAVVDHDVDGLELGGDCGLAKALIDGLHRSLFATAAA